MKLRDPITGQINSWVWVIGAVVVVGGIFLLANRNNSSVDSTAIGQIDSGQSSALSDQLSQLNDLIIGSGNIPPSVGGTPATNPTNPVSIRPIGPPVGPDFGITPFAAGQGGGYPTI